MKNSISLLSGLFWSCSVCANPVFNPSLNGSTGASIGYYTSDDVNISYKGFAGQRYDLIRDQSGILIAFEHGSGDDLKSFATEENGVDVNTAIDEDLIGSLYIQASFNDSAVFSGQGPLDSRELSGRNFTIGGVAGSGSSGNGGFLFFEVESIDESVSFFADDRRASGVLEGSEFSIGIGGSKSLGKYLTISLSTSYTNSELEFTRTRAGNDSTIDFPTTVSVVDVVKRIDRGSFSASLTLNPTSNLHLFIKAIARSEESITSGIRISF